MCSTLIASRGACSICLPVDAEFILGVKCDQYCRKTQCLPANMAAADHCHLLNKSKPRMSGSRCLFTVATKQHLAGLQGGWRGGLGGWVRLGWCGDRPGNGPCVTDIACMGNACVDVSLGVKGRKEGSLLQRRRRRPAPAVMSHFRDAVIL